MIMSKYKNIVDMVCQYYHVGEEELLKKKENLYLIILLMKNLKCMNNDITKILEYTGRKNIKYNIKKAEEKILINKYFREEYFLLEENIKEKIKNA